MRVLIGLAAIAVLAAGVPTASVGASTPNVSFSSLPAGWHGTVVQGDGGYAYALSWRYRQNPGGWASSMPKNGVAVSVLFLLSRTATYPPLRLVLPRKPATTLEGAPDTPHYRIRGRVLGRDVEISVDIRRPHPTKAQLRAAQAVVSAIRFARPS
jgi:hypothetical protein